MLDARRGFRPDDPLRALGVVAPAARPLSVAGARVGEALPGRPFALDLQPGFLSLAECAGLMALIDARRRPSTIADDNGEAGYRTSETCDLFAGQPLVDAVNRRLDAIAPVPGSHGETLQGQRYAVGQEFRAHTDWFEPHGVDYARYCAESGQRVATLMVYLNVPEAGGDTRFFTLDRSIRPTAGLLVAWRNVDGRGLPDPASLHAGEPVRAGVKYIITKWYRELPLPARKG